jgi:hypothetical protein
VNRHLKLNRSGSVSQAGVVNVQGGLCRRIDTIRAVTLERRIMNADRIFGAIRTVHEFIDDNFGKIEHNLGRLPHAEAFDCLRL